MKNSVIVSILEKLSLGVPQGGGRLSVIPIMAHVAPPPDYLTLVEALESKCLEVTEVSSGGSVPELAVSNQSAKPVLLLDGEELAGAKQNRVLNTTILVAVGAKMTIPVSCTEQGRWHYTSAAFSSSGNMMSPKIRKSKSRSVTGSLHAHGTFSSDQSEVWDEITELHVKTGTSGHSQTGAMSDAFAAKGEELNKLASDFPLLPDQTGVLVLRNGRIEGCDLVSRPEAYRRLHDRLIRSYAMDALAEGESATTAPTEPSATESAESFLNSVAGAEMTAHKSPGLGEDYRINSQALAGSLLVVDGQVIHLAAFASGPDVQQNSTTPGAIASLARRRRYRSL